MSITTQRPSPVLARGKLSNYRTIDLVMTAMIGVTFGVAYLGWGYLYRAVTAPMTAFPPIQGLLVSPWLLAGALAGVVVRRPGAALVAEVLGATVEALLGGTWGIGTLYSGVLQGLGIEIALALFAYKRFGPMVLALGGVLSAFLECLYEWRFYWADWNWNYKLVYLGLFAASAAVLLAVVTPALTRALARAGVLNGMPPGQEHARSRV